MKSTRACREHQQAPAAPKPSSECPSTKPHRSRKQSDISPNDDTTASVAEALKHSAVYRRLAVHTRAQLDAAILRRPTGLQSLEEIARRFGLDAQRISRGALRSYARRLEELARPAAASQVLAAIFGCLPSAYERRLLAGTQVLLLSRVVQALAASESALSVAELSRLSMALAALARSGLTARSRGYARPRSARTDATRSASLPPARIAELVRDIYGLDIRASAGPTNSSESPKGDG